MLTNLVFTVAAVASLTGPVQDLETRHAESVARDRAPVEAGTGSAAVPVRLALELGGLGQDDGARPSTLDRRGTSDRVFGPVHPSSRYGTYTGRNLGAYTGSNLGAYTGQGTGSYTGGGLGSVETFGLGQPRNAGGGNGR